VVEYTPILDGSNIKLIVDDDDFLAEEAARAFIVARVPAELRASACETVNGRAGNEETQLASLRACEGSVQTPPFLDPVKLTWWRGVDFLPGGGTNGKISADVKEALEKFAAYLAANPLPPNQFLLITATKLLKTSIFAKAMASCADVKISSSGDKPRDRASAALTRLEGLASARGLMFAPGAAQAFVDRTGPDTRTIVSELDKMREYLGDGGKITEAAIAAVTSASADEPAFWEISSAVGQRNAKKAADLLARFEDGDKIGIPVLTSLEILFRNLVVLREALDRGWLTYNGWKSGLDPAVCARLDEAGVGPGVERRNWIVRENAAAAGRYTMAELRVARWRLLKLREKLVSSSGSADVLLPVEILRIIGKRK